MTESSRFWTTSGTGDGPSGGYSAQQFYDFLRKLLITDQQASQGIIFGEQNNLVATGTASPIAVNTGSAIVYGLFYENTASVNLTVTTPSGGTTGGRVNLKADWTAQTVRLIANRNTDGNPAIPSLTQTPGSVYELPLYTFTITTGGVITLTDVRSYVAIGSKLQDDAVETAAIKNQAVTNAKILDYTIGAGKFANSAVALANIVNIAAYSVIGNPYGSAGAPDVISASANEQVLKRTGVGTLIFGQVDTDGIMNLGVTSAKLASGAVTAGKIGTGGVSATAQLAVDIVGNRVPMFTRRQGGDGAQWAVAGTTDRTPTMVKMQMGVIVVTINASQYYGLTSITYPQAFSNSPVVHATLHYNSGLDNGDVFMAYMSNFTASGCDLILRRNTTKAGAVNYDVGWLAIGPE